MPGSGTGSAAASGIPVVQINLTRQDYLTAIGNLVKGEFPLGETEKILAIAMAMKLHSKHRPQVMVEKVDGTGAFDYAVSALTYWTNDFSVIKTVEYPVDDTEPIAPILQDDAWQIYQKPTGKYLRFLLDKPAATEDIRLTYTALHTCTDAACTVSALDAEAVQVLAASYFLNMSSTWFAQTQDNTIMADSVDHKSKSTEYAARARAYRKMYFNHLGIDEGKTPPASITRDQDLNGSWGTDRLTHPKKYR